MPSETDPLLPQGNSAPEITGYGFSQGSHPKYHHKGKDIENEVFVEEAEDAGGESFDQINTTSSPLRTLLSLFLIVVLFGLSIALLVPKGLGDRWQGPTDDPPTNPQTIEARVNKILSENPLIGLYIFMYLSSSPVT